MCCACFYLVEHAYVPGDGLPRVKRIGLFATRTAAKAAVARVCDAPGFRDHPEGFTIRCRQVQLPEGTVKSDLREVYYPWHEFYDPENDCDVVTEGPFFAREEDARSALDTMRRECGLTAYKTGFDVGSCIIGQACWAEGFTPFEE